MAMYDPRRKKDREEGPSWKKKTKATTSKSTSKKGSMYTKPDGTPRRNKLKITVDRSGSMYNKPDGTPRKGSGIKITANKNNSMYNKPDGTPRKKTVTKQASKKGAVLINGKPPTAIQKRLLAGGWSAKELEAKINRKKKK